MKLVKSVLVAMLLWIMAIQVAWSNTNDIAREMALMDAAGSNFSKVKSLVESGVNINAQVSSGLNAGWTALMFAIHRESYERYETVKYLVSKGADINIVDTKGRNALMIALMEHYGESQRIKIAKYLISKGINVNVRDNEGKTALMYATKMCWIDVVKLLVEKGADVNAEDDEGETALSRGGCANWFLLSKGAKQMVCSADGVNKDLFSAITNGNTSQLRVSIKLGADVNAKDSSCNTALMEAIKNSSSNRMGDIGLEIVKILVENGADVNVKNKKGITPLIYSAGDFDLMKYLIENGAKDVNSALRYATNVEMLKYLISKGANVKSNEGIALFFKFVANYSGWDYGREPKEMQVIEFLMENGIDVNVKNTQGTTAFMIATQSRNLNLMKYLISKGADINAKDNDGKTALDMAMDLNKKGKSDIYPIIEFLLDNGAKK